MVLLVRFAFMFDSVCVEVVVCIHRIDLLNSKM
jgi:hypothetical protein